MKTTYGGKNFKEAKQACMIVYQGIQRSAYPFPLGLGKNIMAKTLVFCIKDAKLYQHEPETDS